VDYGLIGGSGMQAAQMAAEAKVPVVVMSGHLGVPDQMEAFEFVFLQKPFRIAELLTLAAELVGRDPRQFD
jgi:DNA-binding NtrC family response regulator